MRQRTLGDDSLLSCPLHCHRVSFLPASHCSALLPSTCPPPTAAVLCLSHSSTQTFHLTLLPVTHTRTFVSPSLATPPCPSFPIASRWGTTQHFQIQGLQPHLAPPVLEAGMTGQCKALTPKQRLRFETCRNSWWQLSFGREWC